FHNKAFVLFLSLNLNLPSLPVLSFLALGFAKAQCYLSSKVRIVQVPQSDLKVHLSRQPKGQRYYWLNKKQLKQSPKSKFLSPRNLLYASLPSSCFRQRSLRKDLLL